MPEGPVKPGSVTLSPDPPVIGTPATFTVKADSPFDSVPGGAVEIDVSYLGVQIFSKSEDLCEKTTCPVPKGNIEIVLVEDLPPIAPPGDYSLRVLATSSTDSSTLLCLDVDFELVPPSTTLELKASEHLYIQTQQKQHEAKVVTRKMLADTDAAVAA
eukprot:CAMPEP_0202895774 /NCGR_PEP_ID=MMETSP1392-20130828/4910_1 /ASSEMBLY_ACC=CAM_ASM_000868 /TAXON_ID=225041 /ORGANISM="Chlamydomonas chlamydogama, Strain SAG 11-48b" /LENGTH=157 /DNA_ID=CAMNT_0049580903 /DNA_START=131 /DNA_END=604 /DNA_ORIENTATION=-